MIPVRNRPQYLDHCLSSILRQAPGPSEMQIEVVDNSSADTSLEGVARAIGGGRLGYFRQPFELSMSQNWNTCVNRSRGELVHILHDDDWVTPDFYESMRDLADRFVSAGMLAGRCYIVNAADKVQSITSPLTWMQHVSNDPRPNFGRNDLFAPAIVLRRKVYEDLGGFLPYRQPADYEMWMRALIFRGGVANDAPVAYYRVWDASLSSELQRDATNVLEIYDSGLRIQSYANYLPLTALCSWCSSIAWHQAVAFSRSNDDIGAEANLKIFWTFATLPRRALAILKQIVRHHFRIGVFRRGILRQTQLTQLMASDQCDGADSSIKPRST